MKKYLYYALIVTVFCLTPILADARPDHLPTSWGSAKNTATPANALYDNTNGRCTGLGQVLGDGEFQHFANNAEAREHGNYTLQIFFNERVGNDIYAQNRINNNARTMVPNAVRSGQGFALPVRATIDCAACTSAELTNLRRQIMESENLRPLEISFTDVSIEATEEILEFTHIMVPVHSTLVGSTLTVYFELPDAWFNLRAGLTTYSRTIPQGGGWERFGIRNPGYFFTEFSLCPRANPANRNQPARETYQINYTFFVPVTGDWREDLHGDRALSGTITCHYNVVQELFLSASRTACLANDRYRLVNNFLFTSLDLSPQGDPFFKFPRAGTDRVFLNWSGFFATHNTANAARRALNADDCHPVGISILNDEQRRYLRRIAYLHERNPSINIRGFSDEFRREIGNNRTTGQTAAGRTVHPVTSVRPNNCL